MALIDPIHETRIGDATNADLVISETGEGSETPLLEFRRHAVRTCDSGAAATVP